MRYAIFLKEINLSIFSFFSYLRNLNKVTETLRKILPKYNTSTNVFREVIGNLDAELATERWKKVAAPFASMALSLWKNR